MIKKIFIFISLLFIVPNIINASCTDSEIVKMNKLASNVNFTPVFDDNSEKYNIIVSNLSPFLYFVDIEKKITYYYTSNEIVLYNYEPNKSYRFKFYSNNNNCYGNNVISKYITLPGYNKWYKESICKGLEEQKFCQKWTNYLYSEEEINKLVTDYKNSLNKKEEKKEEKKEIYGIYDYLVIFYVKYYFIILPLIIIILSLIIILKKKKNSSLF